MYLKSDVGNDARVYSLFLAFPQEDVISSFNLEVKELDLRITALYFFPLVSRTFSFVFIVLSSCSVLPSVLNCITYLISLNSSAQCYEIRYHYLYF